MGLLPSYVLVVGGAYEEDTCLHRCCSGHRWVGCSCLCSWPVKVEYVKAADVGDEEPNAN